jgi:hypothetical protein
MLRGIAVGIAAVALVQLLRFEGELGRPAAVSETEGEIRVAYIQFERRAADAVIPVYVALFEKLAQTKVIVGCPTSDDWEAFRSAVAERCRPARFHPLIVGRPISTWAKDRFVAVRIGDRLRLLVPHRAPLAGAGEADWKVAWDLAGAIRADVRKLPLDFDGGDLWVAGGRAFVHRSVLERNGDAPVLEILRRELGAEPVVIDGPPHHVGMFATPLHDGRVLAGPDSVADELRRAGHRVIKLPFATTTRDRVYLTYNNVVLSGRRVFMPVFDAPSDDEAEAVWRGEGFEVIRIPCGAIYGRGGTVHCLVNVLERS